MDFYSLIIIESINLNSVVLRYALTDCTDLYLTRRILVIAHTESTETTEIINSHTDLTDLTDFYIPLNFFCPAEPKVGALGEAKWRKWRKFYSHAETQRAQSFIAHTDLTDPTEL